MIDDLRSDGELNNSDVDETQVDDGLTDGKAMDWGGRILVGMLAIWVSGVSIFAHLVGWFAEQLVVISGFAWPVWVWPMIVLGQFVFLAIPLTPLAWRWRTARYRSIFRVWLIAAMALLFLLPMRWVGGMAVYSAVLLQIGGTVVYLLFVWVLLRRWGGLVRPRGSIVPAFLLAGLLTASWVVLGALGSVEDVVLQGVSALLFGLVAGLLITHLGIGPLQESSTTRGWDIVLGGLMAGCTLVILSTAFGFNGQQLALLLILPGLGWVVVTLSGWGRETAVSGWLAVALLIGLVTAAPLIWVDHNELALILNFGTRDVLSWASLAAFITLMLGWVLGIITSVAQARLSVWQPGPLLTGLTVVVWLGLMPLYFFVGQPGWHGERLFVILTDQANVSAAATIVNYDERRAFVYEGLVSHANETQAEIRSELDRRGIDYTPYYLVNAIEVKGGPLVRWWLGSRPEVDRILTSTVLRPLPAPIPISSGSRDLPPEDWNLTIINADDVWRDFGVTGEGIVIGQSDSGVEWVHSELRQTYRGREGDHDYNWLDPWHQTEEPTDIGGHGTHTLGSIVGQTVGVAPGATWYGCANLARNLANPALYLDCMQFMLAPYPMTGNALVDGAPSLGAHVLNNSWGCPPEEGCDANALLASVRALRAAGVFVVVSAGNEGTGGCETVDSPLALYDEVFSVGAADSAGRVAEFSSRGPVTVDGSGRVKPDILAPGVGVYSAMPNNTYDLLDGTSMAGPHVAGVVALLWSANSALIGDIDGTEQIIVDSAQPYDYEALGTPVCGEVGATPDNAVGYGLIDAYAAVQRALE